MNKVDFLLIGQGLAGSLLAYELIRRGYRVMVVDNGGANASTVAAGLINPVTGMRLVKSTDVDLLLPAAKRLYQELAAQFGQTFYLEKPMLRLLRDETAVKQAAKRLHTAGYQAYLAAVRPSLATHQNAPSGWLEQKQTGYLLTKPLLACLRDYFITQNSYDQTAFDYQELDVTLKPQWRSLTARQVVFCEGHHARHNPWFSWLPFQAVKGEILSLQLATGSLPQQILNDGHWLLPLSETQFRTGATFDHQRLDCQPTAAAKAELMDSLARFSPSSTSATVTAQLAGIRPCTWDKQPFTGFHPQHPQLALFNGFGAKGSLQIPLYSQRFADCLAGLVPPPSDISRHYAAHFPG